MFVIVAMSNVLCATALKKSAAGDMHGGAVQFCERLCGSRFVPVDLIVIPRSASSARVSVRRVSPALAMAMIPQAATRESVRVDFPVQKKKKRQSRG